MQIHKMIQGSDAWHEIRAGRITGTRFAALMMKETTIGYQDLIADVTAEIISHKPDEEDFQSPWMTRGKELEPEARGYYREISGLDIVEVGFITPDEGTEFEHWIGVSPDGLIYKDDQPDKGLEIKCPKARNHLEYMEDNTLPNEYLYQVQGALFVSGLECWHFMSYYPNMKPFIKVILPDAEIHKAFTEKLRKFIGQVNSKIESYRQYEY